MLTDTKLRNLKPRDKLYKVNDREGLYVGVASENGIYGHSRFCNTDFDDKLACLNRHCCKVSDEAAFCLIQRPYISKPLLTRRISPRGSP